MNFCGASKSRGAFKKNFLSQCVQHINGEICPFFRLFVSWCMQIKFIESLGLSTVEASELAGTA